MKIRRVVDYLAKSSNSQQGPRPWSQKLQIGDLQVADGSGLGLVEARTVYARLRSSILPCWERIFYLERRGKLILEELLVLVHCFEVADLSILKEISVAGSISTSMTDAESSRSLVPGTNSTLTVDG